MYITKYFLRMSAAETSDTLNFVPLRYTTATSTAPPSFGKSILIGALTRILRVSNNLPDIKTASAGVLRALLSRGYLQRDLLFAVRGYIDGIFAKMPSVRHQLHRFATWAVRHVGPEEVDFRRSIHYPPVHSLPEPLKEHFFSPPSFDSDSGPLPMPPFQWQRAHTVILFLQGFGAFPTPFTLPCLQIVRRRGFSGRVSYRDLSPLAARLLRTLSVLRTLTSGRVKTNDPVIGDITTSLTYNTSITEIIHFILDTLKDPPPTHPLHSQWRSWERLHFPKTPPAERLPRLEYELLRDMESECEWMFNSSYDIVTVTQDEDFHTFLRHRINARHTILQHDRFDRDAAKQDLPGPPVPLQCCFNGTSHSSMSYRRRNRNKWDVVCGSP
eukprot:TRINITY_DN9575_c0_g2_i1.p1 TRINITY_DN9575_c0_g2~~TRINITY_DN9575_c0_g2_i1.p1  ORF type:complete len:385 (+),score=-73.16 TRINITY_DN9575_c0_g2_i1:1343-2497(+)